MTGRVTVLTPVDNTPAIELGNGTWRKQILPVGWLNYDDGVQKRLLNFTPAYLRNLVAAYKAKAFDAVPFQLADAKNAHNNDPERTAGQIIGLDADDQGLYATVSSTERGTQLLKDNPNLGVSVRIVEEHERADGRGSTKYPAALQHVLATWAPRIAGMAPWQAVACADESEGRVLDLSALVFTAGAPDPERTAPIEPGGTETREDGRMPDLTTEEKAALSAILAKLAGDGGSAPAAPAPTAPTGAAPAGPTQPVAPLTVVPNPPAAPATEAPGAQFTPEELVAMAAATPPAGGSVAPAGTELPIAASDEDGAARAVELATLRLEHDASAVELAHVRNELAEARWLRERQELTERLGLPPALVALAEPVLRGTGNAVELSQGAPTEPLRAQREQAGRVMREVLAAMATTYGRLIDLSGPIGSAQDVGQATAEQAARDSFLAQVAATGFAR